MYLRRSPEGDRERERWSRGWSCDAEWSDRCLCLRSRSRSCSCRLLRYSIPMPTDNKISWQIMSEHHWKIHKYAMWNCPDTSNQSIADLSRSLLSPLSLSSWWRRSLSPLSLSRSRSSLRCRSLCPWPPPSPLPLSLLFWLSSSGRCKDKIDIQITGQRISTAQSARIYLILDRLS